MSIFHAFFLGLLQGATEFFPVSSSAHLKLAKFFLGIEGGESQVMFDLICHLGTLVALLYFLRVEIRTLSAARIKPFFFALLPLIPAYFLLKPVRDAASKIEFVGIFLLLTSGILFMGEGIRLRRERKKTNDFVLIGAMQSLALLPGISRSASTISCARILGWSPKEAVRFSFLLAIPTIIGGNSLELLKIALSSEDLKPLSFSTYAVGFFSSLIVGLIAVHFGFKLLERGCFKPFAWYCLILGIVMSVYFYG
jgi:undecaprenyl-diphosphatase